MQGFFASLPRAIAARLRALPCIPTEDGRLVAPTAALVCNVAAIRRLFSSSVVLEVLGKRFVDPGVGVLQARTRL